jgi:hypothetical protein
MNEWSWIGASPVLAEAALAVQFFQLNQVCALTMAE